MDFRFRPEDEAFREEVRAFLKRDLPADWKSRWIGVMGHIEEGYYPFEREMRGKLKERGWLAMSWPKEFGGGGADILRQTVFSEEMEYHRAPGRDMGGVGMVGPLLIAHGTEEQKREHLPPMARGEVIWAQGFSEPEAGSDLASLRTRAVRDGDDYVINGQKVWTSRGHRAQWMHLLARTDPNAPKHKGISYFLVDMKTPGIEVRPLVNIANQHDFNEVFLKDVRVPARNIVGEENTGWYVATTTLNLERSNVGFSAVMRSMLEDTIAYLQTQKGTRFSPLDGALTRHKLADLAVAIQVCRVQSYRVAWMQHHGVPYAKEAAMVKVFATELWQRAMRGLMEIVGLYGQLEPHQRGAPLDGGLEHQYLYTIAATIGAGTSEIQRNLIAGRGLGLPR
ncbi:MAG: acyl-CoA dehydrogenase [Dehalococcoidia bacterium]|nr:acyl-CoA dehydrogenase [Dehalococcoidia bacterium]